MAQLTTALSASRTELAQLDELLTLERQLGQQEQILARVGTHVETARLLATLDEVMPPEMALVDLTFRTEERRRSLNVIWDVLAFWPHAVHPFSPRPYSKLRPRPARARRVAPGPDPHRPAAAEFQCAA